MEALQKLQVQNQNLKAEIYDLSKEIQGYRLMLQSIVESIELENPNQETLIKELKRLKELDKQKPAE